MGGSQPEHLSAAKRSVMKVNPQKHATSRRHRAALSCTSCRKRKVKCDRLTPCTQCVRLNIGNTCTYGPAPRTSPYPPPESTSSRSVRSRPVESARNTDNYALSPTDTHGIPASSTLGGEAPDHDADHGTTPQPVSSTTQVHGDGDKHPEGSAPTDSFVQFIAPLSFRGKQQRTRFFGRSHWATTLGMFPDLNAHLRAYYHDKQNQINPEFAEYMSLKRLKHDMKGPDRRWQCDHQNLHSLKLRELLPERNLAEHLMRLYFLTFEYTLRILHIPSFLGEWNAFWNHMETQPDRSLSSDVFLSKLLLLMACSGCFANGAKLASAGVNEISLMQMCHAWIEAVTAWLGVMTSRAQLSLDLIQIKCLLLLAKQGTAWEGDLASLGAGSLIREAVVMGLHRDPSNFAHLSPYWVEMRKRLWLTIIELELQASLYNGVPLAISWDEFDCPSPSNIEDEDFSVNSPHLSSPKPSTIVTRMTFQITLARTLQTRMSVSRIINRVRLTVAYEEVIAMSENLSKALADAPPELRNISADGPSAGSDGSCAEFKRSFFLFLNYRCLLALHRPFFLRPSEPRNEPFVFSRRACVQISLALLSQLDYTPRSNPNHQFVNSDASCLHILQLKGGMFRDDVFHAAATICYELRLHTKDKVIDSFPGTISVYMDQSAYYQRMALFESVEKAIKYFELKVRNEKRATKVFNILTILFTSIKSQVLAAETSHPTDAVVTMDAACPVASRRCRELLLADEPLNRAGTDQGLLNLEQASTAQGHDGASVQQGMQPMVLDGSQGINPEELNLDWNFSLDPLSPYPINSWPELDPFMV